jgi:hypothetical protein
LNDLLDESPMAFPEKAIVPQAFAASILQALGED